MRKLSYTLALLPLLLAIGCGTLQEGGVYTDPFLYQTDTTLAVAYTTIHVFVKYEYDNRAILAATPSIKQAADRMRIGAPRWFGSAIALRDAYAANPAGGSKDALRASLDVLRSAMAEATKYMAQPTSTPIK